MRVNDLSKELGVANKELVAFLNENGADVKSHMSNVTEEQAQRVREAFGEPKPEPEKPIKVDKPIKKEKPVKSAKAEEIEKASKPIKVDKPVKKEVREEPATETADEEPKKKKLTAVFRPQNAQQPRKARPKVDPSQTGRVITVAKKEEAQPSAEEKKAPVQNVPDAAKPVEKPEASAEPAKSDAPQTKSETKKAPLFEGRDKVTTLGNVFANQPKKDKAPSQNKDGNNRNSSYNANRRPNHDNRPQRPDRNPNQRPGQPAGKDGQPERKPVRFENRNNQKPNPARPGQAPANATNGAFGKKPVNGKQGKNNYISLSDLQSRRGM